MVSADQLIQAALIHELDGDILLPRVIEDRSNGAGRSGITTDKDLAQRSRGAERFENWLSAVN